MDTTPIAQASVDSSEIVVLPKEKETDREEVEKMVRRYFYDEPILSNIAFCESRFTQFDENGDIHRGRANSRDVGVMQINEYYHLEKALELGYDIYSIEGNMAYAKYLFNKQGSAPWSSSSKCWKNMQIAQK